MNEEFRVARWMRGRFQSRHFSFHPPVLFLFLLSPFFIFFFLLFAQTPQFRLPPSVSCSILDPPPARVLQPVGRMQWSPPVIRSSASLPKTHMQTDNPPVQPARQSESSPRQLSGASRGQAEKTRGRAGEDTGRVKREGT